jgi:hypothetical protein
VLHAHKPGSPWSADRDCPPRPLPALLRRRSGPRRLRRRAGRCPRGGAHGARRHPDDRPGRHQRRTSSKRPARALLRGSPPPFCSGARSHVEREERDADARTRAVRRVGAEERRQSRVRSRGGSRSPVESSRRRFLKTPRAGGVRPSNRGTQARTRCVRAAPRRTQPAPRSLVFGQPSRRPDPPRDDFADLPGDGRSAKELEVLRAQAVAEPIALTFRGPLVRHRLGPPGSHVRGKQNQHAAVLPCVDFGRVAHLGVLIVLGDKRDDGDASEALVRVARLRSLPGGRHRDPAARRHVRANRLGDGPSDPSRC